MSIAWGKRDYACINVYQGIPDNSTVTTGQTIHIRFNRKPTTYCPHPLRQYPSDDYSVWLYNNPRRHRDIISFDKEIKIVDGIPESAGAVAVRIPENLPKVEDGSVWYLRVGTVLSTAPQVCITPIPFGVLRMLIFFWFRCLVCITLQGRLPSSMLGRLIVKYAEACLLLSPKAANSFVLDARARVITNICLPYPKLP